jgi:ankyrin repeat protein
MIMFGKKTSALLFAACAFVFCARALAGLADERFLDLCANGSPARVGEALDAGARLDARDGQGATALMYAVSSNRRETASLLLDRGAHIDARDGFGFTALMHAVQSAPESVSLLLARGADANARGHTGLTPLMLAANSSSADSRVIGLLLAAGANVNATDDDGFTPLIFAAFVAGPDVVSALLAAGADALARERLHGKSVADYAAENPALRGSDVYRRLLGRARPVQTTPVSPMMGIPPVR